MLCRLADTSTFSILLFCFLVSTSAELINITIDDELGDPLTGQQISYLPAGAWQQGNGCTECTAKPTPATEAWDDTWHDASFNPSGAVTNNFPGQIITASVQFNGVAVYVYCILTRSSNSPDGNTDMTFFVDNVNEGVFQLANNSDAVPPLYQFNASVFSKEGLSNTSHTFRLESGHAGQKALVLLDSIVYTVDDGEPITSSAQESSTASISPVSTSTGVGKSNLNLGVILGPTISGVLVVGFIIGGLILYYHKQRRKGLVGTQESIDGPAAITPFVYRPRVARGGPDMQSAGDLSSMGRVTTPSTMHNPPSTGTGTSGSGPSNTTNRSASTQAVSGSRGRRAREPRPLPSGTDTLSSVATAGYSRRTHRRNLGQ